VKKHPKLDWIPLVKAFRSAFEWTLDVAADLASEYPEEVAAVERVRAYLHARIDGRTANLGVDDALFTFALLLGAIERELGAPAPSRSSATEQWLDSIVLRQLARSASE
jgi:hypothetical protein